MYHLIFGHTVLLSLSTHSTTAEVPSSPSFELDDAVEPENETENLEKIGEDVKEKNGEEERETVEKETQEKEKESEEREKETERDIDNPEVKALLEREMKKLKDEFDSKLKQQSVEFEERMKAIQK